KLSSSKGTNFCRTPGSCHQQNCGGVPPRHTAISPFSVRYHRWRTLQHHNLEARLGERRKAVKARLIGLQQTAVSITYMRRAVHLEPASQYTWWSHAAIQEDAAPRLPVGLHYWLLARSWE
ncbi:unnamed protein product, partial [Ectocarpus fasciculatus]